MEGTVLARLCEAIRDYIKKFFLFFGFLSFLIAFIVQDEFLCTYFFKDYFTQALAEYYDVNVICDKLHISFFPISLHVYEIVLPKAFSHEISCKKLSIVFSWKGLLCKSGHSCTIIIDGCMVTLYSWKELLSLVSHFSSAGVSRQKLPVINEVIVQNFSLATLSKMNSKKSFKVNSKVISKISSQVNSETSPREREYCLCKNSFGRFLLGNKASSFSGVISLGDILDNRLLHPIKLEAILTDSEVTLDSSFSTASKIYKSSLVMNKIIKRNQLLWEGKLLFYRDKQELFDTRFAYNSNNKSYALIATNHYTCTFDHTPFCIKPYELTLSMSSHAPSFHKGSVKLFLYNRLSGKRKKSEIQLLFDKDCFELSLDYLHKKNKIGLSDKSLHALSASLSGQVKPSFMINSFWVKDNSFPEEMSQEDLYEKKLNENFLCMFSRHAFNNNKKNKNNDNKKFLRKNKNKKKIQEKQLSGFISYDFMRLFLPASIDYYLIGSGVKFSCSIDEKKFPYCLSFAMACGLFYLPVNKTQITSFFGSVTLDPYERLIEFFNCRCSLGKGSVGLDYGIWQLTRSGKGGYVSMPFKLDNFFLNYKNDFYALLYGHLLLSKQLAEPYRLSGFIGIKHALLKQSDLFIDTRSSLVHGIPQETESLSALSVDVACLTEEPVAFKASNFQADIACDLRVKREAQGPFYCTGQLHFLKGMIGLLGKKFSLESGSVTFFSQPQRAPVIDLFAKGRVHKYILSLSLTGPFDKPLVTLEASPFLSNEQIMVLLLSGSDAISLQNDLPALLLHNLYPLIRNASNKQESRVTFFERLTRPLRYIQITPDFTNQAGRGGVKAVLSLDIGDRFQAQIQKNFNLQEDFSFYLQYAITDDLFVKAIKDPRGDLGAEVELRLNL